MNIAGLDIATTTGLTALKGGIYEATTFKASVKKKFLEKEDDKGIDPEREAEIARKFFEFLWCWLIDNQIGCVAIEAPLPSNNTRQKTVINTDTEWAGKAITKETVAGTSFSAIFRVYGLEMIALMVCKLLNIPVIFVHQGTWRKIFLGTGKPQNAKKEAKKMCQRMGINVTSEDAAESVGVCYWLDQHLNPSKNDLFAKRPLPKTPAQETALAAAEALFKPSTAGEVAAQ